MNRLSMFLLSALLLTMLGGTLMGGQSAQAEHDLFLFGGGERNPQALLKMLQVSKYNGSKQLLPDLALRALIITWASAEAEQSYLAIKLELESVSSSRIPVEIIHAPTLEMMPTQENVFRELLSKASLVYFSGGDQNRVLDFLDHNPQLAEFLKKYYRSGVLFAGTSAGTAIMSERAICGANDEGKISAQSTCLRAGLGLLPQEILVDQHFIKRSRYNRVLSALLFEDQLHLAYGIDEDSALWIHDGRMQSHWGPVIALKKKKTKKARADFQLRFFP